MQGQLKSGVRITQADDTIRVAYALWEIALPLAWVRSKPLFCEVLERKRTLAEAETDAELDPLLRLLEAQGCFVPVTKPSYSLREVRDLFDPLRSQWYAEYYAHSLWGRIRGGTASRSELVAWMLHNYHVSRAAGVVGARMAAMGRNDDWRRFFERDALDEYWHCDAYYFINAPNLHVSVEDAKAYVPLPSSLAFEEHTLQVAETDPLGHLLIAYFQESSIAFDDDSNRFYAAVERAYDIPGFFNSWRQHIRIDVEHHHAEGLGALLDSDVEVDATRLSEALENAWLAFAFLRSSLDDIRGEGREGGGVRLRLPVRESQLAPAAATLLPWALQTTACEQRHLSDMQALYEAYLDATGVSAAPAAPIGAAKSVSYLLQSMALSSFRALGFSREHDEIIACGRLANVLAASKADGTAVRPAGPWDVAIKNRLYEVATAPAGWTMLVDLLVRRLGHAAELATAMGIRPERLALAERLRRRTAIGPSERDRWLTALLQFDELIHRWATGHDSIPNILGHE